LLLISYSVSMSLSLGLGYGCCDAKGRYWVCKIMGEDSPMIMTVFDANLERIVADFALPEDVFPWMIFGSPAGQLLLVATQESTIYICEVAEGF